MKRFACGAINAILYKSEYWLRKRGECVKEYGPLPDDKTRKDVHRSVGRRFRDMTENLTDTIGVILRTKSAELEPVEFDWTAEYSDPVGISGSGDDADGVPANLNDLSLHCVIEHHIADGGNGRIDQAYDLTFNRQVALKTLHPAFQEKPRFRRAFMQEARVTAQLDHPSIVPVHSLYGDDSGGLHLSMKLIRGRTLQDYIKRTVEFYRDKTASEVQRAERKQMWKRIGTFRRVCEAIAYAHHRRVIHRDLKPANIMIGNFRETYVMDWGLAEHRGDEAAIPNEKLAGTLRYIAPEVIRGEPYDHRSDIFVLGLLLFEIVYLRAAYPSARDKDAAIERAKNCMFEPARHRFGVDVDIDLQKIIKKALASNPDERYQSVRALEADLNAFELGETVSANPDNAWNAFLRKMRSRSKLLLGISAALLLLFTSAIAFNLHYAAKRWEQEQRRERALAKGYTIGLASSARFDRLFQRYEHYLRTNAGDAALLLELKKPGTKKLYTVADGMTPGKEPPDFRYAPTFNRKLSLGHMVFIPPAGKENDPETLNTMQYLSPVQRSFQSAIHNSLSDVVAEGTSDAEYDQIICNKIRPPLVVAYAGLTSGLLFSYPYDTDWGDDYDPRKRPWYSAALRNPSVITWSAPYFDVGDARDIVMTASTAIHSKNGTVYGVAALDVSLSQMIAFMEKNGTSGDFITNKYLINRRGQIIADTKADLAAIREKNSLDFAMFKQSDLLKSMWQRETGWQQTKEEGKDILYFFFRIESLNWLYVERVELDKLARSTTDSLTATQGAPGQKQ